MTGQLADLSLSSNTADKVDHWLALQQPYRTLFCHADDITTTEVTTELKAPIIIVEDDALCLQS